MLIKLFNFDFQARKIINEILLHIIQFVLQFVLGTYQVKNMCLGTFSLDEERCIAWTITTKNSKIRIG